MHLLFCDTIYVIIPGQCFIYDHTKIFRGVLFVFGVMGSGYVEDITFLGMELPTWPICLDHVEGLSHQYHWILSCI